MVNKIESENLLLIFMLGSSYVVKTLIFIMGLLKQSKELLKNICLNQSKTL